MSANHNSPSRYWSATAIFRGFLFLLIPVLASRLLYRSYQKGTSRSVIEELDNSIVSGDLEKISRLLEQKVDLNAANEQGRNLWDRIAFPPTRPDWKSQSEILPESKEKIPKILQMLLEHGADPNARCSNGLPLIVATWNQPKVVRLLLAHGAKADARNSRGCNALFNYVEDAETMRLLIDAGADVHAAEGFSRQTPLMTAARGGTVQTLRLLLDKGARLEDATTDGTTPLMWAAEGGSRENAALLMERGADIHVADKKGRNVLDHALDNPDTAVGEMFLKKGLRYHSSPERDSELLRTSDTRRLAFLLRCGVNINARQGQGNDTGEAAGNTALLREAIMWNQAFLSQIPRRVDADLKRRNQIKAAFRVAHDPAIFTNVAAFLLNNGADPNLANSEGWTPLLAAVANDNVALVKLLLAQGADVHHSLPSGITPLRIAQAYGSTEVERLLREAGA